MNSTFKISDGDGSLSIDNNDLTTEFKIFPNPVINETLYIQSNTGLSLTRVELYNTSGKLVLGKNLNSINRTEINLSDISKGQYILKIESDRGNLSKNILVK